MQESTVILQDLSGFCSVQSGELNKNLVGTTTSTSFRCPGVALISAIHPEIFFKILFLFIDFWLRWVFVAARGLSLVAASGGYSSLRCAGIQKILIYPTSGE